MTARGDDRMIHADRALARRLENLICAEFRRLAEVGRAASPGTGAECIEVAGGVALWLGQGSPLNAAVGLGMRDHLKEMEIERLETFYSNRGALPMASVCQLADPALFEMLARRGWALTGFEHVLAVELDDAPPGPESVVDVGVCTPEEREIWSRVATSGLADGQELDPAHEELGRIMAARPEAVLVLAWVDGEPAGAGSLIVDGGVGWLSADSTSPQYRRRGVQQSLQRLRLELARYAGCDLAVTEAAPGSDSQRNMERLGFRIVYTHAEFTKARPARS